MAKLRDYLRNSEAAEYLGVSPNTLRNWERAGKIEAHRHPVNHYRLFRQQDLDALCWTGWSGTPPTDRNAKADGDPAAVMIEG